jgi:hypothetical protein
MKIDAFEANWHEFCSEDKGSRRLSCSWEEMVVNDAMWVWVWLISELCVAGWSMVVAGLNGWHWVFGGDGLVVA